MSETVNTPTDSHWYPAPAISDADLTKKVEEKIAKDTENVPPSSATQPCPLAEAEAKKEAQDKMCTFTGVKVSKPERGFDLIVNTATPANQRTLGIVAGFKQQPAKVSYELQEPVGPCPETHSQKRSFNTGCSTFKILPESTENKLELEITSSTKIQLFPWGLTTDKYTISSNRCGHTNESVTVEVYPDTETDVYIRFNFGEKKASTDDMFETITKEKSSEVELRIGGKVKYDGLVHKNEVSQTDKIHVIFKKTIETLIKTTSIVDKVKVALAKIKGKKDATSVTQVSDSSAEPAIKPDSPEELAKHDDLGDEMNVRVKETRETIKKGASVVKEVKEVKGSLDRITGNETQVIDSPIKLAIKYPVINLHVGGSWKEDLGLPTVTYEGKIKLAADPLLGLYFEWNITSTIIQTIPGGMGFQKIKKRFLDGFLELILKAGAEISGTIDLIIKNEEIEEVTGKIKGKVPIGAEFIIIKADINIWIVHVTIEYKSGVESGFEIEISYDLNVKVLNCVGGMLDLVVWWSGFHSFGSAISDTGDNKYVSPSKRVPAVKQVLYKKSFESKYDFFTYDFKTP